MSVALRIALGLALLTLARLVALRFSVVDLYYDESQYWAWAQTPALGYFSKPPLLAWIIAAVGHVCGSSEVCVRAPAPLMYFGTALATFFAARTLYGTIVAAWSSIALVLAPGVIFSARIISTDVPLLFCWSLCVLAFVQMRKRQQTSGGWGWAALLGAAFGFGMLAKYAMIYFALGIALASILDAPSRALLRRPQLWGALALGLIILEPNLVWVGMHDLVTLRHTEDNISGSGVRVNPLGLLEVVVSQFAVFGPVMFAAFLLLLARPRFRPLPAADRVMVAFALPPLVLVALVGLFSKANANWAATSAITLVIVAVAALVQEQSWRWLYATAVLGIVLQAALWFGDARADRIAVARNDLYRRTLGWKVLGEKVAVLAREKGAKTIVSEHRDAIATLIYYLRGTGWPVRAWPMAKVPESQFDIDRPLTKDSAEPLLFVSSCAWAARFEERYTHVESLGIIVTPTGPHSRREYYGYLLSGAKAAPAPFLSCTSG